MTTEAANPTVESRIRELLEENLGIKDDASGNEPLRDQGFDSLDEVEFAMELEEEFDIEIPDEDIDKLETIQQAVVYVSKCQKGGAN